MDDISMGVLAFFPRTMRGYNYCLILVKHSELIQVLLVTGGFNSINTKKRLASTEVYRSSAGEWREVPGGARPRPIAGVRVVTLNNRVLLFG